MITPPILVVGLDEEDAQRLADRLHLGVVDIVATSDLLSDRLVNGRLFSDVLVTDQAIAGANAQRLLYAVASGAALQKLPLSIQFTISNLLERGTR